MFSRVSEPNASMSAKPNHPKGLRAIPSPARQGKEEYEVTNRTSAEMLTNIASRQRPRAIPFPGYQGKEEDGVTTMTVAHPSNRLSFLLTPTAHPFPARRNDIFYF